ncbi:MAG: M48 family metallopeptidase [Planctomycetota bacterium]|jgi:predicted Zn-dependent protease
MIKTLPHGIARRLPRFAVALSALLLVACSTVPYSNRSRMILLSEGEEMQMGVDAYQQILSEAKISNDAQWTSLLRRCGQRIASIADQNLELEGRPPFEWEFNLVDAPDTVNAFCLPGGKVAFYTGILPICRNEAGVAVVMGHEVAHALARHGGERVSQQVVLNLGVSIAAALSSSDPGTQATVAQALGVGLGVAVALPFSRNHESEADYIGLMMMSEAGYDPREAPRFWERMAEASGGEGPPEFLSTHPASETRVAQLNADLPEALDRYEKATGKRLEPNKEALSGEGF